MKKKLMLALVALLVMLVGLAAPAAFAHQQGAAEEIAGEEIAVTGVVKDELDKADGTPLYSIKDESTMTGTAPPKGYYLEGDYSAYVGQRVTMHGTPFRSGEVRVLDVTRIE